MSSSGLRCAVIGTGWWATTTHIPCLRDHPDVEQVLLCDRNAQRLADASAAYHLPDVWTDYREMLRMDRPDAVVIATTHASHYAIARDCLEAGTHLLVEKPLTLNAREARHLYELAKERNLALLVGYPWNYLSVVHRLRDMVQAGGIGTLQFVNCVFNSYCADFLGGDDQAHNRKYAVHGPGDVYSKKEHSGGGHGHLQMTHAAGLLFHVTGLGLGSVRARMQNHGLEVDLVDAMMVEFEGGGLGLIGGTSNAFVHRMDLMLYGSAGSAVLNVHAGEAIVRRSDGTEERIESGAGSISAIAPTEALVAIAAGKAPITQVREGWQAVEFLDAAYRSAESNGDSIEVSSLYV